MHILFLNVQLYPDFIGGVEKRNHDLATALAGRGHRVTLVGFGNGNARNVPGVNVLSMGPLASLYGTNGRRKTLQVFWFAWLVLRLDLTPYDVVEASNIPYLVAFCDSMDSAVPELVRDGVEGLRSPATPEGLCGTLDRLLRDDKLAARLGHAGATRALSYDVERMGRQMEALFQRLIDSASGLPSEAPLLDAPAPSDEPPAGC